MGLLAEYFAERAYKTKIVANLQYANSTNKVENVPVSLGFDSVSRHYAHYVSNICSEVLSKRDRYFFVGFPNDIDLMLVCCLFNKANLCVFTN